MTAKNISGVIIAMSAETSDDIVENFCMKAGIKVFRGSLNNVLERYYKCALRESADAIVRCTADNALIDGNIIDEALDVFSSGELDYLLYKNGLPLGMHVEIFSFATLEKSYNEAKDSECLEHVTPYMIKNPEKIRVLVFADDKDADNSSMRFTMDTPEDYEFVKRVYDSFGTTIVSYGEILRVLSEHKDFLNINQSIYSEDNSLQRREVKQTPVIIRWGFSSYCNKLLAHYVTSLHSVSKNICRLSCAHKIFMAGRKFDSIFSYCDKRLNLSASEYRRIEYVVDIVMTQCWLWADNPDSIMRV